MDTVFVSIFIILAGGTAALFLSHRFILMQRIMVGAAMLGCLAGLSFTLTHLLGDGAVATTTFTWLHIFDLSFTADSVSLFFLIPVFLIPPLALVYSLHYFSDSKHNLRVAINYFFTAVLVASMALVVTATDMISFALAWEVMSIASFFLVLFDYRIKANRTASYLYLIFAQAGALFLFAAFAIIYSHTGSFDFSVVSSMPESEKLLVFVLALIGFGSKAGIFPLHIWLPKAHPAAPSHISAIMSGVMIKMGIYGILRIYLLLEAPTPQIGKIVLITGMITGITGVVYALARQNIKEMLAYSSVENIGIILIGLGIGMLGASEGNQAMAFFGFAGALLHVLNHSIFKSLLFMGAGAVLQRTKSDNIEELGGLLKKMPITGKTFLIGSAAISGLPPFAGFVSEFLIYYGAFQGVDTYRLSFILAIFAIISLAIIGGLATAVFTKVMGLAFLGAARTDKADQATEVASSMKNIMILLAGACLFIGVIPEPFIRTAFAGIRDIPFVAGYDSQPFFLIVRQLSQAAMLFITLVLLVSLFRQAMYLKKRIVRAGTWGCGFTKPTVRMQYSGASYVDEMVNFFGPLVPVKRIYSGISKIFPGKTTLEIQADDLIEMNCKRGLVRPLFILVHKLRWIQHGNIQLYIAYIILALIVLLVFFL